MSGIKRTGRKFADKHFTYSPICLHNGGCQIFFLRLTKLTIYCNGGDPGGRWQLSRVDPLRKEFVGNVDGRIWKLDPATKQARGKFYEIARHIPLSYRNRENK